jgi:hypothetical protein
VTRRARLQRTMQDPHRAARRAKNQARQAHNGRGHCRVQPCAPGTLQAIWKQQ